jgi:hypothetical protein
MTKRLFDFSNLGASGTDEIVVVKAMGVEQWESAQLVVRVHSGTWTSAVGSIAVKAYQTAPTAEDPSEDFYDQTAKATVTLSKADVDAAPFLETAALSTPFGGMLRITVTGTQGATPSTDLFATLSVELVVKD